MGLMVTETGLEGTAGCTTSSFCSYAMMPHAETTGERMALALLSEKGMCRLWGRRLGSRSNDGIMQQDPGDCSGRTGKAICSRSQSTGYGLSQNPGWSGLVSKFFLQVGSAQGHELPGKSFPHIYAGVSTIPTIFALWEGTLACVMAADPNLRHDILGPHAELL